MSEFDEMTREAEMNPPNRIWLNKQGMTIVPVGVTIQEDVDVQYIRADHADALLKVEREKALGKVQSMIEMRILQAAVGGENLLSPKDIWKGIEALILEYKTDG